LLAYFYSMIPLNFSNIELQVRQEQGKTTVFDAIRKKWVALTPEEHVRQLLAGYLVHTLGYPVGMLAVEKQIRVAGLAKRFDIVAYDRQHQPWLLAECKAPDTPVSERTLQQLLTYHSVLQCRYWLLTNGIHTFCADACDTQRICWLDGLPPYEA
jgi:hypothetical protein